MELGERSYIVFNVDDLKASLTFYRKLGFRVLDKMRSNREWALLTDEAILLLLNEREDSFTGLTYMSSDMARRAAALEERGVQFDNAQSADDGLLQVTCFDPNGIGISLIRFHPTGMPDPDLNKDTRCGIFGEFFIPTSKFEESQIFWKQLGFQPMETSKDPYSFGLYTDGMTIIGLHERADITQPALSYFAPDMEKRIKGLKLQGVDFKKEFKNKGEEVQSAVLETPGGYRIFLFQGDFEK